MFEEILEKQKNILGENHKDTLKTRRNLASSHRIRKSQGETG